MRKARIVDPINNDPRNTGVPGTCLGMSSDWIFKVAIAGGQAQFDDPIGNFSAKDRVLLYALFNQKGHVLELIHAFQNLLNFPEQLNGATILDIGCGPFTAGLAIANVLGGDVDFRYFGVDTSREMCALGGDLAILAREEGGLSAGVSVQFTDSIEAIDFGNARFGWTVVVLSYLLASDSLDIPTVVRQIVEACNRIGPGPVAVLYTNSGFAARRASFPEFDTRMRDAGFKCEVVDTEMLEGGNKNRHIHYALFTRGPMKIALGDVAR
ncbi:class I SAM-dependent methyltransferase [Stenotrophomonas maltophilia]|nr:class I SAM-dependent methyltransferase [Stenotrophomonas maltophilia]